MNTQHPLTQRANRALITSLEAFGNTLNIDHKKALFALNDALTGMSEGTLTGRWAFGLPTGTGKTRAIVERAAAIHADPTLDHSFAVSASRIEALCTLKTDMITTGIPESKIGLLHEAPLTGIHKASLPATKDNHTRPFLLCTHAMIRADESNQSRYNLYHGKPRNLLIYDESLMVSDVRHFGTRPLYATLAYTLEMFKRKDEHAEMSNYLTEVKQIIEAAEDRYDPMDVSLIEQPTLDPFLAERYIRHFGKDSFIGQFLHSANIPLRMVKSASAAIVSYQVVVPEALKNVIVLDASYPIRRLCQEDTTLKAADEHLPGLKAAGVKPFHTLKRFDHVDLYRLRSYGGRSSMEKRFRDRKMTKDVVEILKTIPTDEAVLLFVYKKLEAPGRREIDYTKILRAEIKQAGIKTDAMTKDGKPRLSIQTWGNETSLNSYAHVQHVFLVGILHRDETELLGQYLGQIQDIEGEVTTLLARNIQRSEKAHLAYQALSRGSCRFVDDKRQARPMKGYIVEVDPQIEEELSKVMPGANWHTWEPVHMVESSDLVGTWALKVQDYLDTLPMSQIRITSRELKRAVGAGHIAHDTWTRSVKAVCLQTTNAPNKRRMKDQDFRAHEISDLGKTWCLEKSSLVRSTKTAESLGFKDESNAAA